MEQLEILPLPPERFADLMPRPQFERFEATLAEARARLAGRTIWHVSSTATGGGVAEMLQTVLCYVVGAGIETGWLVIDGDDEFFVVTKRLHHMLHDRPGDRGPLGGAEHDLYVATLQREVDALLDVVGAADVVVLHDPQTLGLAGPLMDAGAHVIWACHIGADLPGETSRAAWRFLLPHALRADATVFTRPQYIWEGLESATVEVIPPCIDPFSPKNQPLDAATVGGILDRAGIVAAPAHAPVFTHGDGDAGRVRSRARVLEDAPVPEGAPTVTQISRWDPLKDHHGVMTAFTEHVPAWTGAHLVLAGPAPDGVGDDPEGEAVFNELVDAWNRLPEPRRARVHIASLPMADVDENAAMVNALQRHSDVVVQKSLAEGFGLTVAEAMWKNRPVVASRVGGIQDQIEHGRTGLLLDDPHDLAGLGSFTARLLEDREAAARLAKAACDSVAERYLAPHYLTRYLELALRLVPD